VFDAIWDWNFDPTTKAPPAGWPASLDGNGKPACATVNLLSESTRHVSNAHYPVALSSAQFRLRRGASPELRCPPSTPGTRWHLCAALQGRRREWRADLSHSLVAAMNSSMKVIAGDPLTPAQGRLRLVLAVGAVRLIIAGVMLAPNLVLKINARKRDQKTERLGPRP